MTDEKENLEQVGDDRGYETHDVNVRAILLISLVSIVLLILAVWIVWTSFHRVERTISSEMQRQPADTTTQPSQAEPESLERAPEGASRPKTGHAGH